MKPGAEAHTCNPENQKSRVTLSSIVSSKPAPSLRSLLSEQQQQTHKEPWELTVLFLQLLWFLNYFRKKRYFRVLVLIHCRLESPENLVANDHAIELFLRKTWQNPQGTSSAAPRGAPSSALVLLNGSVHSRAQTDLQESLSSDSTISAGNASAFQKTSLQEYPCSQTSFPLVSVCVPAFCPESSLRLEDF